MGTVVFDLDGTLADTSGDLIVAANAALEAIGLTPQIVRGADDALSFRGGRAMLAEAMVRLGRTGEEAEALIARGYPVLLEAYGDAIDVHTRLYPGAVEAVDALRAAGYRTAICTNKPEGLAETLLARLDLRDRFAALIGADTLPVRKPDPATYRAAVAGAGGEVSRSLLVGDTETDRLTAAAAGVPFVLVGFGPAGPIPADAVIDHFDGLSAAVSRLIGAAGD
ncbi:HAD-IA family hydrolase [Rhodobacterales bacterium HKCCE3408]|nr:HAD-IA family hydrolase [Rhodobacterales bacterium HKCCE3408]